MGGVGHFPSFDESFGAGLEVMRGRIRREGFVVEERERRLLEMFDAQGVDAASETQLALDSTESAAEWKAVADGLVSRGLLKPGREPGTYERTEDGRLAIAGALDVTLYTRPGCDLCDEAKEAIKPALKRSGARLEEINVDSDPALQERYGMDVPVIFLGSRKVAKHRVNLRQFKRQLEDARRKR